MVGTHVGKFFIDDEIELVLGTVYVAVGIHHERLRPALSHSALEMQDTFRLSHWYSSPIFLEISFEFFDQFR